MDHINNSTPESLLNNSSTNRSFFISGVGSGGGQLPDHMRRYTRTPALMQNGAIMKRKLVDINVQGCQYRVPVSVKHIGWEKFSSHVPALYLNSIAAGG